MNATQTPNTTPAALILERYASSKETLLLAKEKPLAVDLLDGLVADSEFDSAIDLLAHWLPPQYAVWWGCLCVWEIQREKETPELHAAMQLIVAWLQNPTEDNRRMLEKIEKLFPARHPVGLLAKSAVFSGGSVASVGLPAVAPPKFLFANFLSNTVKLIAAKSAPADYASRRKQILRLGKEVLHGANRWERS
ncbi:MAG: hypothetical protein AB8B55_13335 [Mariniblastus sp.]